MSNFNVGTGTDMTILQLAQSIARIAGWQGEFVFDRTKPDGMMRKVMDVSRMASIGWTAPTSFDDGMKEAYQWYADNLAMSAE